MKLNPLLRLVPGATLFTALIAISNLSTAAYPDSVMSAGPAAYWRFESVNDVSLTNSFTNSFQGGATVTAAGGGVPLSGVTGNRALSLDGNDDVVRTGVTNQLMFASNGTFMAWVNFSQLPSVAGRPVEMIVKSHFTSPLDFLFDENNRLVGYAGDYTTVYYDFNPALATNTWYHVAFTFDNAAGFKRLYFNGVLVGNLPLNPNLTGSTDEISIGNSLVFTDRSFNGRIDEVSLFNRALTSSEVQNIFASGGVTTPAPQPAVRVNIEITREINALERGMNEYYGLGIDFAIIPAPFSSTNSIYSTHTNHFLSIGGPNGGIFTGSGSLYNTLGEAITEATNGLWTIVLNQGATNEQTYRFTVSVTNLTTNDYAIINITSPVDGSVGNATNVPFTWNQSRVWPTNHLDLDGPTFASTSVPSGSTSWTNAPTLNLGRYDFNLYLRTNGSRWVGITTPTNASNQPLANWNGSSQLTSRRGIRFRVGFFIPPPPGLQAHLRFDDSGFLGLDSSGKDNHANSTWFGDPPTYNANGKLNGAVSFTQGGWLEFQDAFSQTLGADFTVAVWVKTTQNPGSDSDDAINGAGIVGRFVGEQGNNTIPIALNGSKAGFLTANQSNSETLHSISNINNSGTNWVHVAVTRVQATGEKRIYINGVLDNSATGNTNLLDQGDAIRVGYGNNVTYNGLLDDLQIYSAPLTSSDIATLFANPGQEITNFAALGDAVDAPQLTWTTGGNGNWFSETTVTHDGIDAAQSGAIGDNKETWIQTSVTGPGTLSFWWKVSSEDGADFLEFLLDGNFQNDLTGEINWGQQIYQIASGTHTLRWRYYKDGSAVGGLDAGFLDQVSYVPTTNSTAPVITVNPFSQTNYPGYNVALLADSPSTPTPTWQWYKVSSGAIPGATNKLFIPTNSGNASVSGSYFAIANNSSGSATSLTAVVTFLSAPLPPDWSRAFRSSFTENPANTTENFNLASMLDSAGNIYSVGSVTGTNVFGSDTLISANGFAESSFLKQTATGVPIWGRCMTNNGNGNSFPRGLAAAPGDGFYVVGLFRGTNWLGTNQLVDTAGASTYLARFDANGSNLWIRTILGTNFNFPTHHALVSDPAGNVTLSALIWGYTSFGTTNIFAEGQRGVLAQYDANGNLRWLQMPSAWPDGLVYSGGSIYGCMGGNLTNYIGGVTNVSDRRRALFSINATNGQGVWLRAFAAQKDQGSPNGFGDNNASVTVSGTNVFVIGSAYGTNIVFGPYALNFPDTVGQYFARYDTSGNAQVATAFGSRFTWTWAAIADASGNVYVGADFDTYSIFSSYIIAAPFYETVQSIGTNTDVRIPGQAFVAKFDRNGNPLWARLAQSQSSYLNMRDITLASDGVWACGFFNQIGIFGANTISGGIPPYHRSGYLAKITDGTAAAAPVTIINPGRSGGNFTFQFLSQSGFTHIVEARPDVATGTWTAVSNLSGDGTIKTIQTPATNVARFFRVRTQ